MKPWPTSWLGVLNAPHLALTRCRGSTMSPLRSGHSGQNFVVSPLLVVSSFLKRNFLFFPFCVDPDLYKTLPSLWTMGFKCLPGVPTVAWLRLVYTTFKADLKARWQCHRLQRYYRCKLLCDRCLAVQPQDSQPLAMTYKNTAKDAPYATTCIDHAEYMRTTRNLSPWCAIKGFQFETISFDTMHLIYLGIARNHIPSCLKLLKIWGFHYEPNETDAEFLKRVSLEMKQDCKEHKILVLD